MLCGKPITVIIKTFLFISAVCPAPPASSRRNDLIWYSTHCWKTANNSQHVSDFCTATSHSGMTLYPVPSLTNCVAACHRRSANESAGARLRLATRRRRRRRWRRRTVEDCSGSSNGPWAPQILTESNTESCVIERLSLKGCVCLQDGDKECTCARSLFFTVCCLSDTELEKKSMREKHAPSQRQTHNEAAIFAFPSSSFFSLPCVS